MSFLILSLAGWVSLYFIKIKIKSIKRWFPQSHATKLPAFLHLRPYAIPSFVLIIQMDGWLITDSMAGDPCFVYWIPLHLPSGTCSLYSMSSVLSSFPYPLDQYKMYRFIIHLKKIIIVFAPLPPSVPPPFLFFQFIAKFLEKCCLYIMSAFSFPWPLKWLCAQGSVLASFSFMFTYRKETS